MTTLSAGSIAILGFNGSGATDFSFVLLSSVSAGTQIVFTDTGVLPNTNEFSGNNATSPTGFVFTPTFAIVDGASIWTAPSDLPAGTVVNFVADTADFTDFAGTPIDLKDAGNTVASEVGDTNGDQLFAFQAETISGSTVINPTFLFGIQSNSNQFQTDTGDGGTAGDDPTDPNQSGIPRGLIEGQTALALGSGPGPEDAVSNLVYTGPTTGSVSQLQTAVADLSNWTSSDTALSQLTTDFTVPGAAFNNDPVIVAPGSATVGEDDPATAVPGLSITDVEGDAVTVLLNAIGLLTVGTAGVTVTGNGSSSVSVEGSLADVNTALAALTYEPLENFDSFDAIEITVFDKPFSSVSQTIPVTVTPVADPTELLNIETTGSFTLNEIGVQTQLLLPDARVVDPDTPYFSFGQIRISFASGGTTDDQLSFRTVDDVVEDLGVQIDGTDLIVPIDVGTGAFAFAATIVSDGSNGTDLIIDLENVAGTGFNYFNHETVDIILRSVTYSSTNPVPGTKEISVEIEDGNGLTSVPLTLTREILADNVAPVLSDLETSIIIDPSAAATPQQVDSDVTLVDLDSTNFDGGSVRFEFAALRDGTGETLSLQSTGAITVSGVVVSFGGTQIGSISASGPDGAPLVVSLNSNATPTAVEALIEALHFNTTNPTPPSAREVSITVSDGDGGTSTPQNVSISIQTPPPPPDRVVDYLEDQQNVLIDDLEQYVSPVDALLRDDPSVYAGGTLTVTLTSPDLTDRIDFFSEAGTTNEVLVQFGNLQIFDSTFNTFKSIGTVSFSNNDQTLTVQFNTGTTGFFGIAPTPAEIETIIHNLIYSGNGEQDPTAGTRNVDIVVSTQTGPADTTETFEVVVTPVADAPEITGIQGELNIAYAVVSTTPLQLASSVSISDVDTTDFGNARLTVGNRDGSGPAGDLLTIADVGDITITGSTVYYFGTAIGTVSGGTDGSDLVIEFSGVPVSAFEIEQLIQAVRFQTTAADPADTRVISFTLEDGEGGTSEFIDKDTGLPINFVTVSITGSGVNDAPEINGFGDTPVVILRSDLQDTPQTVDDTVTITDTDSTDFDGGELVARVDLPRVGPNHHLSLSDAAPEVSIVADNVFFNGNLIGTILSDGSNGSELRIGLSSANATIAAVELLIESIQYQNTSDTPQTTIGIQVSVSEGDGATSDTELAVLTIQIDGTSDEENSDQTLTGTQGDDTLRGFGGDDTILGLGGNDLLDGGPGEDELIGGSGEDTLDGGEGNNTLKGGSSDDELRVWQSIQGDFNDLNGGSGNDTADFSGFTAAIWSDLDFNGDRIWTKDTTDAMPGLGPWRIVGDLFSVENLTGTAFDDWLSGDAGNNTLDGGTSGGDYLEGEGGNDILRLSNAAIGDMSTLDGGTGTDEASFASFTSAVWVDLAFGTSGEAWTKDLTEATPGPGPWRKLAELRGIENLEGTAFDDYLLGDDQDNNLLGGLGADVLQGRLGSDTLMGDTGNDTIILSESAVGDFDLLFGGDDTDLLDAGGFGSGLDISLLTGIVNTLVSGSPTHVVATVDSIENIIGTAFDDRIDGSSKFGSTILSGLGNDTVQAVSVDANTIRTDGGDDLIEVSVAKAQNETDTLDGGADTDTVDFSNISTYAIKANLGMGAAETLNHSSTWTVATLTSIEHLIGSFLNDELTGSDGDDTLAGSFGRDTLIGGLGSDLLQGGLDEDELYLAQSAAGDIDTLDGGANFDVARFDLFGSAVWVDLAFGASGEAWTKDLTEATPGSGPWRQIAELSEIESLQGSDFDDYLLGDGTGNLLVGGLGADVLHGRGGSSPVDADTLIGGEGDDTILVTEATALGGDFDGGADNDWIDFSGYGTGVWLEFNTGIVSRFTDLELIAFTTGIENAIGTDFADFLRGDTGENHLIGGLGADGFIGFGGSDTLEGGIGNDVFQASTQVYNQVEHIDGGADHDVIFFSSVAYAVEVNLGTGIASVLAPLVPSIESAPALPVSQQVAAIQNIEEVSGSIYGDLLIGSAGDDTLAGFSGDDTLDGGLGSDRLEGTFDNDLLRITQSAVGDIDTLEGGTGINTASFDGFTAAVWADLEFGGTGGEAWTKDTSEATPGMGPWRQIAEFGGIQNLVGTVFDDQLIGDANGNVLTGGLGADVLQGRLGSDALNGDDGDDILRVWQSTGGDLDSLDGGADFDTADFSGFASSIRTDFETDGLVAWTADTTTAPPPMPIPPAPPAAAEVVAPIRTIAGFTNIEAYVGTAYDDVLAGDSDNNIFDGHDGSDTLEGRAGDDTLTGGLGSDTLLGGEGNDELRLWQSTAGDVDELNGGAGGDFLDTADFSGFGSAVWIDLDYVPNQVFTKDTTDATPGIGPWRAIANLVEIEIIQATGFDDWLSGSSDFNRLDGGLGSDTLEGRDGNDILRVYDSAIGDLDSLDGGVGHDTADFAGFESAVWINLEFADSQVWTKDSTEATPGVGPWRAIADLTSIETMIGTAFDDYIIGDTQDNTFEGGAGNDNITGGIGNDTMSGDAGDDIFVFADGSEDDVITDFEATNDNEKIDLSGMSNINSFADLTGGLMQQVGTSVEISDRAGSTITLNNVAIADLHDIDFIF